MIAHPFSFDFALYLSRLACSVIERRDNQRKNEYRSLGAIGNDRAAADVPITISSPRLLHPGVMFIVIRNVNGNGALEIRAVYSHFDLNAICILNAVPIYEFTSDELNFLRFSNESASAGFFVREVIYV